MTVIGPGQRGELLRRLRAVREMIRHTEMRGGLNGARQDESAGQFHDVGGRVPWSLRHSHQGVYRVTTMAHA